MRFLKGFSYAVRGIVYSVNNERNMRIHTVVAVYVLFFSNFFYLSQEEFALLLLTICMVIFAECINSAVEALSDLLAKDYNPIARIVKDISAGAVLICTLFSVFIAICIFRDINGYIAIYHYFSIDLIKFVILLASFSFSLAFIILGPSGFKYGIIKLKNKFIKGK